MVHVLGPSFLEHIAVPYLKKKIQALEAREKWEMFDGQAINNVSQHQSGAEQVLCPRQRLCGRRNCRAESRSVGVEKREQRVWYVGSLEGW